MRIWANALRGGTMTWFDAVAVVFKAVMPVIAKVADVAFPLVGAAALGHLLFGDVKLSVTASLLVGAIPPLAAFAIGVAVGIARENHGAAGLAGSATGAADRAWRRQRYPAPPPAQRRATGPDPPTTHAQRLPACWCRPPAAIPPAAAP